MSEWHVNSWDFFNQILRECNLWCWLYKTSTIQATQSKGSNIPIKLFLFVKGLFVIKISLQIKYNMVFHYNNLNFNNYFIISFKYILKKLTSATTIKNKNWNTKYSIGFIKLEK
jgi:hypothetical protein